MGSTIQNEDIRNQNLIYSNEPNQLITCARVVYRLPSGTINSFIRIIKTDLDGNIIWNFDYNMYPDPLRNFLSFHITNSIDGDGYVVCGAINNDSIAYGNELKPFALKIDENGNVMIFKEYSFLNQSAVALKITNTPDGHYAMVGMESDQFDTLTCYDRKGFLTQLDANLNVNWWRTFASTYSRTMSPSFAPRFDWANEVISFKRPGDTYEVYFVGGAQTKEMDFLINPNRIPHNSQGWLFDNLGNQIWTINECIVFNTLSTAVYDNENNVIYASTNSQNGGNAPHNHILKINAVNGVILDASMIEIGSLSDECEANGHVMSITNLKIENDNLYLMGYEQRIEVKNNSPKDFVYNPFIVKLDKTDLSIRTNTSYIWDDNTQYFPTAHPSIRGVLGYEYPLTNYDYQTSSGSTSFEAFPGHMSYNPRAFIKDYDKFYFLSFNSLTNPNLYDLVLKTNNFAKNYCNTFEYTIGHLEKATSSPILSEIYDPNWIEIQNQNYIKDEPDLRLTHCESISCAYPDNYLVAKGTGTKLKSEQFKSFSRTDLTTLQENETLESQYCLVDIMGRQIYNGNNSNEIKYNGLATGIYYLNVIDNNQKVITYKFIKH